MGVHERECCQHCREDGWDLVVQYDSPCPVRNTGVTFMSEVRSCVETLLGKYLPYRLASCRRRARGQGKAFCRTLIRRGIEMSKIQTFFVNGAKRGVSTDLACRHRAERRKGTLASGTPVPAPEGDLPIWGAKIECGRRLWWSIGKLERTTYISVVYARGGQRGTRPDPVVKSL